MESTTPSGPTGATVCSVFADLKKIHYPVEEGSNPPEHMLDLVNKDFSPAETVQEVLEKYCLMQKPAPTAYRGGHASGHAAGAGARIDLVHLPQAVEARLQGPHPVRQPHGRLLHRQHILRNHLHQGP
jgi:hypothetical protein